MVFTRRVRVLVAGWAFVAGVAAVVCVAVFL